MLKLSLKISIVIYAFFILNFILTGKIEPFVFAGYIPIELLVFVHIPAIIILIFLLIREVYKKNKIARRFKTELWLALISFITLGIYSVLLYNN